MVLLFLNLLVLVAVHARRLRQSVRSRGTRRFDERFVLVIAELERQPGPRDPGWLRAEIGRFDELERPLAAVKLIERLRPASQEERRHVLDVLREVGAIDPVVRSTASWMPWRRALAIRTLGWVGAEEAMPVLVARLSDRNRHVREAAVRALGRIGNPTVLPKLAGLYQSPGPVGTGVVYDALIALGPEAATVFVDGLHSPVESVRVSSCFGVVTQVEPAAARSLLVPLLADEAASVRAGAAESLGLVGGEDLPGELASAVRDPEPTVRTAAAGALGSFDDPWSVDRALDALLGPDHDAADRAGESLVRLTRRPVARPAAEEALRRNRAEWPVEQAVTLALLGAV